MAKERYRKIPGMAKHPGGDKPTPEQLEVLTKLKIRREDVPEDVLKSRRALRHHIAGLLESGHEAQAAKWLKKLSKHMGVVLQDSSSTGRELLVTLEHMQFGENGIRAMEPRKGKMPEAPHSTLIQQYPPTSIILLQHGRRKARYRVEHYEPPYVILLEEPDSPKAIERRWSIECLRYAVAAGEAA